MARPNTPDLIVVNEDGTTSRRIRMKRCCNGCDEPLGDVTMLEIDAATTGQELPDVRRECPTCGPVLVAELAHALVVAS